MVRLQPQMDHPIQNGNGFKLLYIECMLKAAYLIVMG